MLRVAIPVTIVVVLGVTMLVSWLDPLKVLVRLPIDSGKLVISGTKITMEAPKLSGYTRDQRWYEMNAKRPRRMSPSRMWSNCGGPRQD